MTIEQEIKQSKFRNPRQKAGLNILYTANWLSGLHKEFFRGHGITSQQYNILRILRGQYPVKITGTEIRSRMLDQNSDVSRLLDRLLLKKLVLKTLCEDDKRSADILISEKGLELLAHILRKVSLFFFGYLLELVVRAAVDRNRVDDDAQIFIPIYLLRGILVRYVARFVVLTRLKARRRREAGIRHWLGCCTSSKG